MLRRATLNDKKQILLYLRANQVSTAIGIQISEEEITRLILKQDLFLINEVGYIRGVLGIEVDEEAFYADILILHSTGMYLKKLWDYCVQINKKRVKKYQILCDKNKEFIKDFCVTNNFIEKDYDVIFELKLSKNESDYDDKYESIHEVSQQDFNEVIELHDTIFPKTFINGNAIITSLNETKKIFVYKQNSIVLGYIYIDINKEVSKIEFLGVREDFRNKGIGSLLIKFIGYILSNKYDIKSLKLDVNSSNKQAIALYKKLGWNQLTSENLLCFMYK